MGERFFDYIRFKGLSQKKVSELSCVSESVISRFCHGGIIASDKLLKLLQICDDLSLEWFFYGTGEMIRSREMHTNINMGSFAGADVATDGSVQVKNSSRVHVNQNPDKAALLEKDRIIAEKDAVISDRDRTISELQSMLLRVSRQ